jgi:hypothetical protein
MKLLLTAFALLASVPLYAQLHFNFTNRQHVVIIPFEQSEDGHVFFKGRVNDSGDLDFLLDPGTRASGIVVDPMVAKATNFPQTDSVILTLKTLRIVHQRVTWTPLKEVELKDHHSVNGVMGYEFLRSFVVRIDPHHKWLILTDPAYFQGSTLKGKLSLGDTPPDLTQYIKQGKTVTLNYPKQYMVISE